jgi:Fe-S-cluster containining protein
MSALREDFLMAEGAEPGRACGECTVCCTVLAETQLNKPMRCACLHVRAGGCGIYETRPAGCREFHCLWLRGALAAGESQRPDHLGVLLDCYRPAGAATERLVALEVWTGAFDEPAARELIESIAGEREIELSRRDGSWTTRSPAPRRD